MFLPSTSTHSSAYFSRDAYYFIRSVIFLSIQSYDLILDVSHPNHLATYAATLNQISDQDKNATIAQNL